MSDELKLTCVICKGEHATQDCPQRSAKSSLAAPAGSERSAFEKWISEPPYERETARWTLDETKHAWPGQYKDSAVQLAWESWQQAPNDKLKHGDDNQRL